jgi:hypothetical protein
MAEGSRERIMEQALRRGPLVPPPNTTAMAEMEETARQNLAA